MSNIEKPNIGIFDPKGINLNPLNSLPYSANYHMLSKFWSNLPAYAFGKQIVESINLNDILLISSGTGSGKTVLVSKFALHAMNYNAKIVITLPKRIITKKAAEFAAQTLDIELGADVGYQFKGENLLSENTKLLYSTDGAILSQIKSDPLLSNIDIVIIDEAHERKIQIDLLLYLLKNAIQTREINKMKPLKLIIMSATINEKLFANYYKEFKFDYMHLSGKPNYPIKSIYLESSLDIKTKEYITKGKEIILNIVKQINKLNNDFPEGDILFFVCTIAECKDITAELDDVLDDCFVMAVYSSFDRELEPYLTNDLQYKELNSKYKRRIFISTNVAESSITIGNIVYVVDSGLEIGVQFDPKKKINILKKNFITQAQISQRIGRSGRLKPGICYHLYTQDNQINSSKFPESEIRKENLSLVSLDLLKIGSDISKKTNGDIFTVKNVIDMYVNFIETPYEPFIIHGIGINIKYGLINDEMRLSQSGKLIVNSKLNIFDGLSLIYANNISSETFDNVLKIICVQSFIKHGCEDWFYSHVKPHIKKSILTQFISKALNSEHVLLGLIYDHIEQKSGGKIFNIETFQNIKKMYLNQKIKLEKTFKKFNIEISNIETGNLQQNIIYSFNYGYRENKTFRKIINKKNTIRYQNLLCSTSKAIFKYDKFSSIIFHSNLLINGKLNITICSPYLLKNY